jgi:hypothetical protein
MGGSDRHFLGKYRQSTEKTVALALQHGPGVEAALTSAPDPSDVV